MGAAAPARERFFHYSSIRRIWLEETDCYCVIAQYNAVCCNID
jgi:hypothetical protein